ncbi:response regulator transcription factor [sulfur-oxidizing endosymbiont of Gigantopelta aegis]|uniref:response regulator transcription factor n=1 Tax=sulfur-oxidizing endosymbiont of Gigantopelta aegis TaxID=2794934 RepID=UPI0018DDEEC2|nr:response regulator [sulfur-oxidizing endosymbiont of Gigantopelta aegis]
MKSEMQPTVYIIDDDKYARESLEWLVDSVHLPVKAFEGGQHFLDFYKKGLPGCAVMDVRMPDINGIDLHIKLKEQGAILPVIIMTGHADVPMAIRAMKAGVYDFIEKPYNDTLMLQRIQSAMNYDSDKRQDQIRVDEIKAHLDALTPREREVLGFVLHSTANKIIASELKISIKTVELHRANLMTKMQTKSVTELVRLALIAGLE